MGAAGQDPKQAARGKRKAPPYEQHKPDPETWCGKCNRSGYLPICYIKDESVKEGVAFCNCPHGYYKLQIAIHRNATTKSYYSLPDEMAFKDIDASKEEIMAFHRIRLNGLHKSLGQHYYDEDKGEWVFPDGVGFPKNGERPNSALKTSDVLKRIKQEVESVRKQKPKSKPKTKARAKKSAKRDQPASGGTGTPDDDLPF